jgi:hypothetical protein
LTVNLPSTFKASPFFPIASALSLLACAAACSPSKKSPPAPSVASAIAELKSGAVIEKLSQAYHSTQVQNLLLKPPQESLSTPEPKVSADSDSDPCPFISQVTPDALAPEWNTALSQLGLCLRRLMMPADVAAGALNFLKVFNRSVLDRSFSRMTDQELYDFIVGVGSDSSALVGRDEAELAVVAPGMAKIRNSLSERDLDELVRLASRRLRALSVAEAQIFTVVDAHRALVDHFAAFNNRYALLAKLRDSVQAGVTDPDGKQTLSAILPILTDAQMQVPAQLDQISASYLHPMALLAITPQKGGESEMLEPVAGNPLTHIRRLLGDLGGSPELVSAQRKLYNQLKDADNPPVPEHPTASLGAARVAVLDTGVDYLQYPALSVFLSSGGEGALSSYDFADHDSNPYLKAWGGDAHGSGTTASVLTVLAHYAPEVLAERKLDLAVWKTSTVRSYLAYPYMEDTVWQSRMAIQDALILSATAPPETVKPQVVSISAVFFLERYLQSSGKTDAVLRAPWLWVMAAGNGGVELEKSAMPACLDDVPSHRRVDSRILCVGALKRGILEDAIAKYSNFGERVDVYAYETYHELCPNGTSCATPAVTAAAAALVAKFPALSLDQVKQVIVQASDERILEVEGPAPQLKRKIRVFDPATMLGRAFALASQLGVQPRGALTAEPVTSNR